MILRILWCKISPSGQLLGWNLLHRVIIVRFSKELTYWRPWNLLFISVVIVPGTVLGPLNIYNMVFTDEWFMAFLTKVPCLHCPKSILPQCYMAFHKPYFFLSMYLQNEANASVISWHESFQLTELRQAHLPNMNRGCVPLAGWMVINELSTAQRRIENSVPSSGWIF